MIGRPAATPEALLVPIAPDRLERPVFAVFADCAARNPRAPAVLGPGAATTYGDLLGQALRIAAAIDGRRGARGEGLGGEGLGGEGSGGEGPEPVAVAIPASAGCLAALLGALAAGRPYVPIDPSFPAARNELILGHAGVRLVLTDRATAAGRPELMAAAMAAGATVLAIDDLAPPPAGWSPRGGPDDAAYVLYTSGSTGRPKGVWQTQRGLLHDVFQYRDVLDISAADRLTWLYSPAVNGAIRDMYGALLAGAAVIPVDLRTEGVAAAGRRFAATRPTIFHAMPTVLRVLADGGAGPAALGGIRVAYLAGERILAADLARVFADAPADARIYVGIGSTENATIYRHWLIDRETCPTNGVVPVGWPVADRSMRLVDAGGRPVPDGDIGEIEVESRYMAAGYWRDPELTAATFLTGGDVAPGARRLRPGDLGRIRADGQLEFLGRADGQLKIRGHRVEPAEVEAALRALPGVGDAAVLPDRTPQGETALAGVVVPAPGRLIDPAALRSRLAAELPPHLVPRRLLVMAELPRLANFKLDGRALADCLADLPTVPLASPAPALVSVGETGDPALADAVDRAWAEMFGAAAPLAGMTFTELGGDSLELMRFATRVETLAGRPLPVTLLNGAITPADLRRALSGGMAGVTDRLLFFVPGVMGMARHLIVLAARCAGMATVRLVALPDLDAELSRRRGIEDLAAEVADRIAAHLTGAAGPDGATPDFGLVGLSFGGRLAVAAAQILADRGLVAGMVVVGDIVASHDDAASLLQAGRIPEPSPGFRRRLVRGIGQPMSKLFFTLAQRPDHRALRLVAAFARRAAPGRRNRIRVERALISAIRRAMIVGWQPGRLDCRLLLIVTSHTRSSYAGHGHLLGWDRVSSDVRLVEVAGDHAALATDEANLARIVAAIGDAWPDQPSA
ncbi:AMP-binding protein [Tistrella mobilis]|nr:AMP-binding protein [Tistrella mobilis]